MVAPSIYSSNHSQTIITQLQVKRDYFYVLFVGISAESIQLIVFLADELDELELLPHAASVEPAIKTVAPAANNLVNFIHIAPLVYEKNNRTL